MLRRLLFRYHLKPRPGSALSPIREQVLQLSLLSQEPSATRAIRAQVRCRLRADIPPLSLLTEQTGGVRLSLPQKSSRFWLLWILPHSQEPQQLQPPLRERMIPNLQPLPTRTRRLRWKQREPRQQKPY